MYILYIHATTYTVIINMALLIIILSIEAMWLLLRNNPRLPGPDELIS